MNLTIKAGDVNAEKWNASLPSKLLQEVSGGVLDGFYKLPDKIQRMIQHISIVPRCFEIGHVQVVVTIKIKFQFLFPQGTREDESEFQIYHSIEDIRTCEDWCKEFTSIIKLNITQEIQTYKRNLGDLLSETDKIAILV